MEITTLMELCLLFMAALQVCVFIMVLYQIIDRRINPMVSAIEFCILQDLKLDKLADLIKSAKKEGYNDARKQAIWTADRVKRDRDIANEKAKK